MKEANNKHRRHNNNWTQPNLRSSLQGHSNKPRKNGQSKDYNCALFNQTIDLQNARKSIPEKQRNRPNNFHQSRNSQSQQAKKMKPQVAKKPITIDGSCDDILSFIGRDVSNNKGSFDSLDLGLVENTHS